MISSVMGIKRIKLSDICEIRAGYLFRSSIEEDNDGDVRVIQLSDVGRSLILENVDLFKSVKIDNRRILDKHLLKDDDILFKAKSTNHVAAVFRGDSDAVATHHFFILRIRPIEGINRNEIFPPYLALYINLPPSQTHFSSNRANTHIINKNSLESLEITLPDIEIQKNAVNIYENLTKQMEYYEKIIEHKKGILDLTLNNLLGISNASKS
ncbi:restriction endonuclease subunit S [candidate division WOR-3 bacterium]|nr:restriction endonuclease subunit S [candidate division WOR-3 bacterium]